MEILREKKFDSKENYRKIWAQYMQKNVKKVGKKLKKKIGKNLKNLASLKFNSQGNSKINVCF